MNAERPVPRAAPTARRLGQVATVLVAGGVGVVAGQFALATWTDIEIPDVVDGGLAVAALGMPLVGLCLGLWTCRRSAWGLTATICGGLFLLGIPVWGFALGVAAMDQDLRLRPPPPPATPGPPPAPPPVPPGG